MTSEIKNDNEILLQATWNWHSWYWYKEHRNGLLRFQYSPEKAVRFSSQKTYIHFLTFLTGHLMESQHHWVLDLQAVESFWAYLFSIFLNCFLIFSGV